MNFGSPRVLIMDDREEEGIRIAKALWESGLSARFVKYDEKILVKAAKRKLKGVRVFFMDINLLGGAMGAEQMNFSAVQQCIQSLLDDENGPFLLITWSSHDDYADRLFVYLNERLPEQLKPAATARLDKSSFLGRNKPRLKTEMEKRLVSSSYFTLLWSWESAVFESAAHVTSQVAELALGVDGGKPNSIGTVLKALATAEAGKRLSAKNAVRSYSSVLNQILLDCTEARVPQQVKPALTADLMSLPDGGKVAPWKRRANRMINIDETSHEGGHSPGDVYPYPEHSRRSKRPLPNVEHDKFLIENFVGPDFAKGKADADRQKSDLVKDWKLVLVEVTPPCDHAQAKQVWHRYVVGAEMSEESCDTKNAIPSKADYLMKLPAVQLVSESKPQVLILNSRLVVSISPKETGKVKKRKYRLRSQLLGDVIGWLSRQQSRIGYVLVP
jgi:hypothetical protein